MITVIEAPNKIPIQYRHWPKLFLAGSIEMGAAKDWQSKVIKELESSNLKHDLLILNPRRKDWDSSWKQDIDNPQFRKQVNWELNMLEDADLVIFNFDPNTKSPVTLMELGFMVGIDLTHCIVLYCAQMDFGVRGMLIF